MQAKEIMQYGDDAVTAFVTLLEQDLLTVTLSGEVLMHVEEGYYTKEGYFAVKSKNEEFIKTLLEIAKKQEVDEYFVQCVSNSEGCNECGNTHEQFASERYIYCLQCGRVKMH